MGGKAGQPSVNNNKKEKKSIWVSRPGENYLPILFILQIAQELYSKYCN